MKTTKKSIYAIFFFFSVSMLFSNTWTLNEDEEKKLLVGENGKVCEIFTDIELSPSSLAIIENTLNTLWAIPGLTGTQSLVSVESDEYFYFIIYPTSLMYGDIDLKGYLPSGLSFRYDTALFYDITLKVDEYLPRISGAYVEPAGFLDQLYTASVMPEFYLHGDVLLQRIARLEDALMAVAAKGVFSKPKEINDSLVLEIISLHKQNPNITIDETVDYLKDLGFDTSSKEVVAVFMVYLGEFIE